MNRVNQLLKTQKQGLDSRKFAQFYIHVRIVRLYFKLNNYKLCKAIFETFEQSLTRIGAEISQLPSELTVVFCFFKGRYHLYNNEMQKARLHLRSALQISQENGESLPNQQKILRFLIPAEMQTGKFPSDEMLEAYSLTQEFQGVREACLNGDIKMLEDQLETNMQSFISSGIYLAVEKMRHLTLRNLFKQIALDIQASPETMQPKEY